MKSERTLTQDYLRIVKGFPVPPYLPPEEQGRKLKRCTLLEEANFSYSNHTPDAELHRRA